MGHHIDHQIEVGRRDNIALCYSVFRCEERSMEPLRFQLRNLIGPIMTQQGTKVSANAVIFS